RSAAPTPAAAMIRRARGALYQPKSARATSPREAPARVVPRNADQPARGSGASTTGGWGMGCPTTQPIIGQGSVGRGLARRLRTDAVQILDAGDIRGQDAGRIAIQLQAEQQQ